MESKEWESTRWRQEIKKLHLKGGTHEWEREAMEDKGLDSIGKWRKVYSGGKEEKKRKKIKKSRSAKDYQKWMLEERPRKARFRCCNEWRGDRYGETEEKKVCRTCRGEEETWQHLRERCLTRTDLGKEDIMLKDGEGTVWMRKVYAKRKEEAHTGNS